MKKQITFFIALLIAIISNAQTYKVDLEATLNDDFKKIKEGTHVKISRVIHTLDLDEYENLKNTYSIVIGTDTIPYDDRISSRFDFKYKDIQNLWNQKIICNVYFQIAIQFLNE